MRRSKLWRSKRLFKTQSAQSRADVHLYHSLVLFVTPRAVDLCTNTYALQRMNNYFMLESTASRMRSVCARSPVKSSNCRAA